MSWALCKGSIKYWLTKHLVVGKRGKQERVWEDTVLVAAIPNEG